MIRSVLVAMLAFQASGLLLAAPGDVSLTKPTVACPQTQLGDEALQSQYDGLWHTYNEKVAAATKAVENELTRLYESAKSDGNLDLALFWSGLKKTLAETGHLRWEPTSQKKDWKRFGEAEFPDGLTAILSRSDANYGKARDELGRGYKALEVALTKADKLEQALAMRKEFDGLWGAASPRPVEPSKPDPRKEPLRLLADLDVEGGRSHDCWSLDGDRLICSRDGNPSFATFTFQSAEIKRLAGTGEYDLSVEMSFQIPKEKFGTDVVISVPGVPGRPSVFLRHYWGQSSSKVMLLGHREYQVNGKPQPSVEVPCPFPLDKAKKVNLEIKVRNKGKKVSVVVNGRPVIDCVDFPGQPRSEEVKISVSLQTELVISDMTMSETKK